MTTAPSPYRGFRFPAEVIEHAVWLHHCFSLSLRDVETILAARGIVVSYESIREWGLRFGRPGLRPHCGPWDGVTSSAASRSVPERTWASLRCSLEVVTHTHAFVLTSQRTGAETGGPTCVAC
jgi:hypothetical protein